MAMSECYSSIILMRNICNEMGHGEAVAKPTVLFGDNNAANRLTEEMFVSTGMQYIYMPYHHIKEGTQLGEILVLRKPSKSNLADLFTKNVSIGEIKALLNQLTGYDTRNWMEGISQSDWDLARRFFEDPNDGLSLI